MKYSILILINVIVHTESSSISLCKDVAPLWNMSSAPEIFLLREKNSDDVRMKQALSDADCWLHKSFKVNGSMSVPTKRDAEALCYRMATVPIHLGQLLVVVTEGSSAQNCTVSLYGPIPNILNVQMYVDGTKNESTKRMELSLRTTGGHFGVQFELHRPRVASKIQKSVQFMLRLSAKTLEYAKLLPFWEPTIDVVPKSYHYRAVEEEQSSLTKLNLSISWVLVVSVIPMIVFGVVVSCYIVIHPRGGLTYTDEEVDFTIQEVDSNSRVNTVAPKVTQPIQEAPLDLGVPAVVAPAAPTPTKTAKEPEPKTALVGKSLDESLRVNLKVKTNNTTTTETTEADTLSVMTGKE